VESWWNPGAIDPCSKNVKPSKITQEFLVVLEESWRNLHLFKKMLKTQITQKFLEELTLQKIEA
jgi:hypothetical protein